MNYENVFAKKNVCTNLCIATIILLSLCVFFDDLFMKNNLTKNLES